MNSMFLVNDPLSPGSIVRSPSPPYVTGVVLGAAGAPTGEETFIDVLRLEAPNMVVTLSRSAFEATGEIYDQMGSDKFVRRLIRCVVDGTSPAPPLWYLLNHPTLNSQSNALHKLVTAAALYRYCVFTSDAPFARLAHEAMLQTFQDLPADQLDRALEILPELRKPIQIQRSISNKLVSQVIDTWKVLMDELGLLPTEEHLFDTHTTDTVPDLPSTSDDISMLMAASTSASAVDMVEAVERESKSPATVQAPSAPTSATSPIKPSLVQLALSSFHAFKDVVDGIQAGDIVQAVLRGNETYLVLGITRDSLAVCHTRDEVFTCHTSRLKQLAQPNAGLEHVIKQCITTMGDGRHSPNQVMFAIGVLIAHFHGNNGVEHRDPVLAAATLFLMANPGGFDKDDVEFRRHISALLKEIMEQSPDAKWLINFVQGYLRQKSSFSTYGHSNGKRGDAFLGSLAVGLNAYLDSLNDDGEVCDIPAVIPGDTVSLPARDGGRCTGLVLSNSVLPGCKCLLCKDEWFDVIHLDGSAFCGSYNQDELDVLTEHALVDLESDEVAELAAQAVYKGSVSAMRFLVDHRVLAEPRLGLLQLLTLAMLFRTASEYDFSSAAKQAHRDMLSCYKALGKEHRGKAIYLIPELVDQASRKSRTPLRGSNTLFKPWKQLIQDLALWNFPGQAESAKDQRSADQVSLPQLEPLEQIAAAETVLKHDVPASPVPVVSVAPDAITIAPVPMATPAPTRSVPSAKLAHAKFKVTDYCLFATEWQLPQIQEAHAQALTTSLKWLSAKMGIALPENWSSGGHEIEHAGYRLQVEASQSLFAFRLEHPDAQLPTRTWRLEMTSLQGKQGGGAIGLRLTAQDRIAGASPPRSVPGLVRALARSPGLLVDGASTLVDQAQVSDLGEFDRLIESIEDSEREAPVWVISNKSTFKTPPHLVGLSRVITIGPPAAGKYTLKWGRIPAAGMHVFHPGQFVPVVLANLSDPQALKQLTEETLRSRHRPQVPSFQSIRDAIRDVAAGKGSAGEALVSLVAATRRSSVHEELLDMAMIEKRAQDAELEQTREQLRQLQAKLHAMQGTVPDEVFEQPHQAEPAPATLAGLATWSASIAPRVLISDKALRFATKVEHKEVEKIFATLQALHDDYWPMRWGEDEDARDRWLDFLDMQRLRCGQIGLAVDHSHFEAGYQAKVGRRIIDMTLHIQGSSSRDPTRCIRIYFHPDEATRQIVIGHLPTHLANTLT